MPLTLHVAPIAQLRAQQAGPVSRRLLRLAEAMIPTLRQFWAALFADVRAGLHLEPLRRALQAPHLLDAERYLLQVWEREVEDDTRTYLPLLVREQFLRVGEALDDELEAVAGQAMTFQPETLEVQDARDTYVGEQLTGITATTLLGARWALRGGRAGGLSVPAQAQRLRSLFGLTPVQVRQLDTAQQQWQAEGRAPQTIQAATAAAVTRGLAQRTRVIAETEAFGVTNLGQRQAMTQAVALRPPSQPGLMRYWNVIRDRRACEICVTVPGLNPQGVGLSSPFVTP